eukprot:scaffold12265_cov18-Tisochrysis_lutea.AAC.1
MHMAFCLGGVVSSFLSCLYHPHPGHGARVFYSLLPIPSASWPWHSAPGTAAPAAQQSPPCSPSLPRPLHCPSLPCPPPQAGPVTAPAGCAAAAPAPAAPQPPFPPTLRSAPLPQGSHAPAQKKRHSESHTAAGSLHSLAHS